MDKTKKIVDDLAHNAQCVCEHPVVIQNPQLGEYISRVGSVHINGRIWTFSNASKYATMEYVKEFSPKKLGVTPQDVDKYFLVDSDGEILPVFLVVPCGHCHVCKDRKINSFVQRCSLETACYEYEPWFCTLTYDNEHLPACGVNVRDLQLFFKRLRQNLVRKGYDKKIRYVAVGEYGKNSTHRAHYHCIIWNLPFTKPGEYLAFHKLLRDSWLNGHVHCRVVDPQDDKAAYYTAKYMRKTCKVPKGKQPTFMTASRGKGGIGSRWIDEHKDEIIRTLNTRYKYKNPHQPGLKNLIFDQYVLNRVLPSWCRSVPVEFRRTVRTWYNIYLDYMNLREYEGDGVSFFGDYIDLLAKKIYEGVSPYMYINQHMSNLATAYYENNVSSPFDIARDGELLVEQLESMDLGKAYDTALRRNVFLARLYEYATPVDVANRSYRSQIKSSRSYATEIL